MGLSWLPMNVLFDKSRTSFIDLDVRKRLGFCHKTQRVDFYYNKPSESRRVEAEHPGETAFDMMSAFHAPFPADLKAYASMVGWNETQDHTLDPILRLPTELSDLIFSFLSVPALDAARYTSRAWWFRITNSKWILTSVLQAWDKGKPGTRKLLKSLDLKAGGLCLVGRHHISHQSPTFNDFDGWEHHLGNPGEYSGAGRTRFRLKTCRFSMPPISQTNRTKVDTLEFTYTLPNMATSIPFMVFEAVYHVKDSHVDRRIKMLVLYRFDSASRPEWVGFIYMKSPDGPFTISVTEVKPYETWIFQVHSKQSTWIDADLYSITAKKAFSKNDSRYVLQRLDADPDCRQNAGLDSSVALHDLPLAVPTLKKAWKLLNQIYVKDKPHQRNYAGRDEPNIARCVTANQAVQFHIAEEIETGNLALVSSQANHRCQPKVLFSPPSKDFLYQNIATSQEIIDHACGIVVWVAVIWYDRRTIGQAYKSVLYLYELYHDTYLKMFRTAKNSVDGEIPWLQGRRVQSLPSTVGGTHPCSPLSSIRSWPTSNSSQSQVAPSGFQVTALHTASSCLRYAHLAGITLDHEKCTVWGPSRSDTICKEIIYRVYDFSYTYFRRRSRSASKASLRSSGFCACALHDVAFDVVLPDITVDRPNPQSRGTSHKSIFPGRPRVIEKPAEDIGTITEITSPERQRALDRVRDWPLGRGKGLQRAQFAQ